MNESWRQGAAAPTDASDAARGGARPHGPLLLMAYECRPNEGSEAYVGWGRVLEAAKEFEIHVIVSAQSYAAAHRYLQSNTLPGKVHFHTPKPDFILRALSRIPKLFAYNYVVYHHWQRLALRLAAQLHREHTFALVHQVNVCTFREPGYGWRLGIPFIWGPVGGTQNFPFAFLRGLTAMEAFKEGARSATNWLSLRVKRRVRKAAKRAAVLIAANSTNQRDYERVFRRPVELQLETGLHEVRPADPDRFLRPGPLRILWSGEFTTRKALPLLLQALARVNGAVEFQLRVLGRGPLEGRWKKLAREVGLGESCRFVGQLALSEAIAQLEWAELFAFTSLRDTSGNVVLEALGRGVPVLCFDHQGVGDMVTAECGIKIPVTNPVAAVGALAAAIRTLAEDRKKLAALSSGASRRAAAYLWSRNGERVNSIYRQLIGIEQTPRA